MIEFYHGLKTLFLKWHDLGRIRRKVTLVCWHIVAIHINSKANIAQSREVLGDIDIKAFKTLIVMDNQHQRAWTSRLRRSHHMA